VTFLAIRVEGGRYQVYRTTNGIDRTDLGLAWTTPKAAITYLDTLEERYEVSPLRAPSGDPAVPPLAGSPLGPLTGSK
jgi:hypothetical protein